MRSFAPSVYAPLNMAAASKREMREILESAVKPEGRVKLGSLLAQTGRKVKLTDEEHAAFKSARDEATARAVSLE